MLPDLAEIDGTSRIDYYRSGFFYALILAAAPDPNSTGRTVMAPCEASLCKSTFFLIKDWDSFQVTMRFFLR